MQSSEARESVKTGVETQDSFDSMTLHDGDMYGVARRQAAMPEDDLLCALDCPSIYRQNIIDDPKQGIERGLNRVPTTDGGITMQDFLQYLGVGNHTLPLVQDGLEQTLRVGLVRMRSTHQIHRNVGIDQNHE